MVSTNDLQRSGLTMTQSLAQLEDEKALKRSRSPNPYLKSCQSEISIGQNKAMKPIEEAPVQKKPAKKSQDRSRLGSKKHKEENELIIEIEKPTPKAANKKKGLTPLQKLKKEGRKNARDVSPKHDKSLMDMSSNDIIQT